jgi:hypothetical protein
MGEGDNAYVTSNKYVRLWMRSLRVDTVGSALKYRESYQRTKERKNVFYQTET